MGPWGVTGPCDLKRGPLWLDMRFLLAIKGTYFSNSGVGGSPFDFFNRFILSRNLGNQKKFAQIDQCLREISLKKTVLGPLVGFGGS